MTWPSSPTRWEMARARSPGPPATSSQVCPGCGSPLATSQSLTSPVFSASQSLRRFQPGAMAFQPVRLCWRYSSRSTMRASLPRYCRAMGERTEYAPGTFSWADLTTTDADGAKAFYTALFGWDAEDTPIPDGGVYTMLSKGGKAVGALSAGREGQPAAWNTYVTVASADDSAEAAAGQGGTVAMAPFDVMDVGRMAVVQDPTGAFFAVWEPRANIGAGVVN